MHQLLQETLPNGTSNSYTYDGFGNQKYTCENHRILSYVFNAYVNYG
nr:RHS repeat domain-containing protein [Bacillus cereus]